MTYIPPPKESKEYRNKKETLRKQGFRVLPKTEIGGQRLRIGNEIVPKKYDLNFPQKNQNPIPIAYLLLDGNIRRVRWEKNPELEEHLDMLYKYFNRISKSR